MRFHREAKSARYDAIVIGAGLGGLTAGALLARRGRSVLVVERHDRPGGYAHAFRRRRYRFDSAIHLMGGGTPGACSGSGLPERVLRRLGVRGELELLRVDPFYAGLFPGLRIDAPLGHEAFVDAHAALFPREAKGLGDLLSICAEIRAEALRVPELRSMGDFASHARHLPRLMRYHRATLGEVMRDTVEDPRARAVFATLWPYLGLPPERLSFLYWAMMLMSYVEDGAYYVRGSFQNLARALAVALERSGGELLLKSSVRRILAEDGRVRGVVLENGQRIEAPVVVSNADARQTCEELLGRDQLPRRLRRTLAAMRPSVSAFLVYGAAAFDARRARAAHEMFLYDGWDHEADFRNLERGRFTRVGLGFPSLTDPSLAPAGEHVFQITALIPHDARSDWRAAKGAITDELIARADRAVPGLRDGLRFTEAGSPRTLERYTRNEAGAMYGWELAPDQVGPLRLAGEMPVEGLHLAGHWTQPGGGVYGVMASGVAAAGRILGDATEARTLALD